MKDMNLHETALLMQQRLHSGCRLCFLSHKVPGEVQGRILASQLSNHKEANK